APANEAVKYKTVTSKRHFFNRSPWIGPDPRDPNIDPKWPQKLDEQWAGLYDYGTSAIPSSVAERLPNETLPHPNEPGMYVIQLEVFHHLHCLNMIRQMAYPDEYPDMWEYKEDGKVNHDATISYHIDHCIESLRQYAICNVDTSYASFHHNPGDDFNIFPNLWATHTCRDFDAVKEWALERQATNWQTADKKVPFMGLPGMETPASALHNKSERR
ncbi:hypothetical protein NA57DRAFT_45788, partial [Rhizodiscina lignyota]